MGVSAVDALLEGLVDYAGLFPPAALPMRDAVARYASYLVGPSRRMLGRFVVPVARLDELALAARALPNAGGATNAPWRLSALATAEDTATLDAFNVAHRGRLLIDTVESRATSTTEVAAIAAAFGGRFVGYVEVGVASDPAPLIAAIKQHRLRAKLRTGGVTLGAFPSTDDVLTFLAACDAADVPFKATAGLHHPIRGEYALTYADDSPRGTMHGFLNLFLAALLLRQGTALSDVAPLLEERDPAAIVAGGDTVRWRDLRIDAAAIVAARTTFAGSFGSCSFDEPVRDLTQLRFLHLT